MIRTLRLPAANVGEVAGDLVCERAVGPRSPAVDELPVLIKIEARLGRSRVAVEESSRADEKC